MKPFHKKRLLQLAKYLQKVSPVRFNMDCYSRGGSTRASCGSMGCALGHAAEIPVFRKSGYKLTEGGEPIYKQAIGLTAAELFFGLSWYDTLNLFGPSSRNRHERQSPKCVGRNIKKFVEGAF